MVRGFDGLSEHLTDLKDMVIDQNYWYEEIFYAGGSCSNPSDVFDINDEVQTESDACDPPKVLGLGARMRKKRADQK